MNGKNLESLEFGRVVCVDSDIFGYNVSGSKPSESRGVIIQLNTKEFKVTVLPLIRSKDSIDYLTRGRGIVPVPHIREIGDVLTAVAIEQMVRMGIRNFYGNLSKRVGDSLVESLLEEERKRWDLSGTQILLAPQANFASPFRWFTGA